MLFQPFEKCVTILSPGFTFAGCVVCGACANILAITSHEDLNVHNVQTKAQGNVFMTVNRRRAVDDICKLSTEHTQVDL